MTLLEAALYKNRERFQQLDDYICVSAENLSGIDRAHQQELYSSWVLLIYASLEAAYTQIASAALDYLAAARTPVSHWPEKLRSEHVRRTSTLARDLQHGNRNYTGLPEGVTAEQVLSSWNSENWRDHAIFLNLEGNVWPGKVAELFKRIGIPLNWLQDGFEETGESLSSIVSRLVDERNGIGHGGLPDSIRSREIVSDWIHAVADFADRVGVAVIEYLLTNFFTVASSVAIGTIDRSRPVRKGSISIRHMLVPLEVGDPILVSRGESGWVRVRVRSVMSDGVALRSVSRGMERVSIRVNRAHRCEVAILGI